MQPNERKTGGREPRTKKVVKRGGGGKLGKIASKVRATDHSSPPATGQRIHISANPSYLSVSEAAFLLGVKGDTVRLLFSSSLLAGFRVRKALRIYRWSVEHYIESTSNQAQLMKGLRRGE